MIAIRTIYG